jgi:hypothetical protein
VTLNDPIRAIFLYSRNGTHAYEPRSEYLAWFNVDWGAMDKTNYPKSEECVIDEYTVVEDSYNEPTLIAAGKECVNYYTQGKHIYPSLQLCADAVKANDANCASGNGHFFYSITEEVCRCCN